MSTNRIPYENEIVEGDSLHILKEIPDDSIDSIVTDPPYGYSFMNKDWDKAVVSVDTWKECLRVLKPGAFAFIMSSPRQDVLCKMILNLIDSGFETNFTSIYWTYASGFPKAANVSKLVDKRNGKPQRHIDLETYLKEQIYKHYKSHHILATEMGIAESLIRHWIGKCGDQYLIPTIKQYQVLKQKLNLDDRFDKLIEWEEAEREIIAKKHRTPASQSNTSHEYGFGEKTNGWFNITKSATEAAKRLDGAYCGYQPKPALETILVVMKPLSEKSFVDQALKNGKGITWLDDCRIPFQNENDKSKTNVGFNTQGFREYGNKFGYDKIVNPSDFNIQSTNEKGRFPANLIVSDDSLNDGKIRVSKYGKQKQYSSSSESHMTFCNKKDKTIEGVNNFVGDSGSYSRYFDLDKWYSQLEAQFIITPKASPSERQGSTHPTMKPIKLMSYLITLGSRPKDIILDPFVGSGTTCIAALQLGRQYIGIEQNKEYVEIARKRLEPYKQQTNLFNF